MEDPDSNPPWSFWLGVKAIDYSKSYVNTRKRSRNFVKKRKPENSLSIDSVFCKCRGCTDESESNIH